MFKEISLVGLSTISVQDCQRCGRMRVVDVGTQPDVDLL